MFDLIDEIDGRPTSILLYGPPKIGKTRIVSALAPIDRELGFILSTEPVKNYFRGRFFDIRKNTKLKSKAPLAAGLAYIRTIRDLATELEKREKPFEYVILDNLSDLETWATALATWNFMQTVQGKNWNRSETDRKILLPPDQWNSVLEVTSKDTGSVGYLYLRNALQELLDLIATMANRVIYLGHIKDIYQEVTTKEVATSTVDLIGKNKTIVSRSVDAVGQFKAVKNKRFISFVVKDGDVGAGARSWNISNTEVLISELFLENRSEGNDGVVTYWENIFNNL